ncbi:MAG TPA: DUF4112 domain-containing protein [Caulobacteraceae bacterium]
MSQPGQTQAHHAWLAAERIKLISDRLIGLGPFGVGIDGLLAFVPFVGGLYSLIAGIWLIAEGVRGGANLWTLARMTFYVGFRTAAAEVPVAGQAVDFFFRGHLMAAVALQKDIARRHGAPAADAIEQVRRHPFAALGRMQPAGA